MYLQRCDFAVLKTEDELKFDGAAGESSGDPSCYDGPTVLMNGREGLDGVLVFLLGLRLPLLNGGSALDGAAFIPDNSMLTKALRQGFGVISILGGEVGGDRFGKIERHKHFPLRSLN
jgi:hypothetical protein